MARVDVVMPKMGESVMEGTVLTWSKQPGDTVELDETLLEISTDKVDSEVPSPSAGVLVEILVPEGETVDVGARIAVIDTDVNAEVSGAPAGSPPADAEEEARGAEEPASKDAEPPMRPADEAASNPKTAPSGVPAASGKRVEVVMPKMGESVMEGTVLAWKKQPGDTVELDETLLDISTDKVDSEVPSPSAGVLAEIVVPEGETVDVGAVIAYISVGDAAGVSQQPSAPAPKQEAAPKQAASGSSEPEPAQKGYGMAGRQLEGDGAPMAEPVHAGESGPVKRRGDDGRFYSPLVRSIAEKEGISMRELEQIEGSGAEGRVTKKDVMGYLENRKSAPAAQPARQPEARPEQQARPVPQPAPKDPSEYGDRVEVIEMDRMRQIIAEHMTRSKSTSAHVTSFNEIDVTSLVQARERNKDAFFKREGVKLTYTPFFVKAAVEALRTHPMLNASVEGKRIIVKKDYHVGIAVAIGKAGLLVPVVRDAGRQNLAGLAHAVSDLAERARTKKLLPDELQGGTFTVTNVGSLGSLMGTPVINQPQVAILSPGAIKKRPVVVEHPELGDIIAIRQMMFVSLSYDHRIIDGSMGASYLQAFKLALESIDPNEPV
jgi:pyruvate dehydrogenase E2 component (dihydrolipoamide acetyltransferase)